MLLECLGSRNPAALLDEPGPLFSSSAFGGLHSGLGAVCLLSSYLSRPSIYGTGFVFQVKLVRLVGIMLLLYVKAELALNISEVEVETVGTGIMGRMVRMAIMRAEG